MLSCITQIVCHVFKTVTGFSSDHFIILGTTDRLPQLFVPIAYQLGPNHSRTYKCPVAYDINTATARNCEVRNDKTKRRVTEGTCCLHTTNLEQIRIVYYGSIIRISTPWQQYDMTCYINVNTLTLACFLYVLANAVPNAGLSFVTLKSAMPTATRFMQFTYIQEESIEGSNNLRLGRFTISNLLQVFLNMPKLHLRRN
jgi:hypothetical protein